MKPRDTPEQVDRLHAAGWRRDVELDGRGIWVHPTDPNVSFHGADNALAHIEGQPLPHPAHPWTPWIG